MSIQSARAYPPRGYGFGRHARGAWVTARDKRRLAQAVDAADDVRRWNTVMREIERQTGYQHQSDTAKRMTES